LVCEEEEKIPNAKIFYFLEQDMEVRDFFMHARTKDKRKRTKKDWKKKSKRRQRNNTTYSRHCSWNLDFYAKKMVKGIYERRLFF